MNAGAGLCDEAAVRVLVDEGPDRVRELMEICPRFDNVDGQIVLGREGAHSVARVVHAGGDATGSEVSSALAEAARWAAGCSSTRTSSSSTCSRWTAAASARSR